MSSTSFHVSEFGMAGIKGQIVPNVKANLPNDFISLVGQKRPMRELMTPAEFVEMFVARTKALREHSGLSMKDMALALDIPFERYKKYETRSPLPHELVERFALITRVPVEFVMTGRRIAGKGPYPDVPGPHMLDDWRKRQEAQESGTKRATKKNNG